MNPFDMQSLDIARQSLRLAQQGLVLQYLAVGISGAALIAAIVAGVTIWLQLRASQWNALLQFEMDMNGRWRDLAEMASEVQNVLPRMTDTQRSIQQARLRVLRESYLNSVDRLASSILNGQFPSKKLKSDYRGFVEDALREYPEAYQAGTRLRNTVALHNKWCR